MRSTAHDNCHVKCTMEYTFFLLQELPKICTYLCTTLRSAVWNVFCGVNGAVWRKIPLYGIFMPYSGAKWVLKPCKNCAGKLTFGKVNKLFGVKLCGMTRDTKKAPSGREPEILKSSHLAVQRMLGHTVYARKPRGEASARGRTMFAPTMRGNFGRIISPDECAAARR